MTLDSGPDAPGLIGHFERTLGTIKAGWSVDPDGAEMPYQIVQFTGGSDEDSVGYSTLGLSRHTLATTSCDQTIRLELLMLAPKSMRPDLPAGFIQQVASMVLKTHQALLRGSVIGPAGALVPGSELTALYVTMPSYFPVDFATYPSDDGDIAIAWLVPITSNEANFVAKYGWDPFEDALVEQDPDLVDFHRPEMEL